MARVSMIWLNPKAKSDDDAPVSLAPLTPEGAFRGLFKVKPPEPVKRGPRPKAADE